MKTQGIHVTEWPDLRAPLLIMGFDASWEEREDQIQDLIKNSLELQTVINELRKAKVRGTWESMKKIHRRRKGYQLKGFYVATITWEMTHIGECSASG